jgi:hypothetical protein
MTTHDPSSLSLTIARCLALALARLSPRMQALRERLRRYSQNAARRDAYAQEFRQREERRRLWMR